jgi:predicted AAA+ superfamily ATPase
VEVNFVEEPRFKSIIEEGYKPENIIKLISKIDISFRFEPNKTLIFFDEVQELPESQQR